MNEELDPQLLSLFAETRAPLDNAEFLTTTLSAIERQLRLRTRYRLAALTIAVALAVLLTPWLLDSTGAFFNKIFEAARGPIQLAGSPWAWVFSVPIGVLLLYRSGFRLRR
jgi:hypothetical protein